MPGAPREATRARARPARRRWPFWPSPVTPTRRAHLAPDPPPFPHDLPDQLQVRRTELLPIRSLEKLRALAQLDDQHRREVRVLLHEREVQPDEPFEPRRCVLLLRERGLRVRDQLRHLVVEQLEQQVVLALEVEIDGAVRDTRGAGDFGDGRAEVAALREHLDCRVENACSLVVALFPSLQVAVPRSRWSLLQPRR